MKKRIYHAAGFQTKLPMMKAPGCQWEMWRGVIGITPELVVYDAEMPVGEAKDLPERSRRALAKYMIDLWTRFGEGQN